jgi:hypothetical protein
LISLRPSWSPLKYGKGVLKDILIALLTLSFFIYLFIIHSFIHLFIYSFIYLFIFQWNVRNLCPAIKKIKFHLNQVLFFFLSFSSHVKLQWNMRPHVHPTNSLHLQELVWIFWLLFICFFFLHFKTNKYYCYFILLLFHFIFFCNVFFCCCYLLLCW